MIISLIEEFHNRDKKNKSIYNVFDNNSYDESKEKLNELIYFLIEHMQVKDDIKEALNKTGYAKYNKYIKSVLNKNKEAIVMYLRLALDIFNNQNIDESKLNEQAFSTLKDFNSNLDVETLEGKTVILNQIRNAFAHKTGKIQLIEENNIKKVKINNKKWFSIQIELNELNSILKNITIENKENKVQNIIQTTINCIQNSNYDNIPKNADLLVLMNLLICYNKESIFDKFMETQSSFIDASCFSINTTANWNITEQKLRNRFFDKYDIFFVKKEDKDLYDSEWRPIVDIDTSIATTGLKYRYDTQKMPYDYFSNKHIPIPIFLTHLRNAVSHGRVNIEGDTFEFFDKKNDSASEPYFFMKISRNELLDFMYNDYFIESILTTFDNHKKRQDEEFYLLEEAESANEFDNFMSIYKMRLSSMNEEEIVEYMYMNNKLSSYIMEHPDQILSFLKYKLANEMPLIAKIAELEKKGNEEALKEFTDDEHNAKICTKYYYAGLKSYIEFISDLLEKIDKGQELNDSNNDFFEKYYAYLYNSRSFLPNIKYTSLEDLNESDKAKIKEGGQALREEFIENNTVLKIDEYESTKMLTEAGMQMSDDSEFEKIKVALAASIIEYSKDFENEEIEEKKHNIFNVEKHSTIAHVHTKSAQENLDYYNERRKTILKLYAINLGAMLLTRGIGLMTVKMHADPAIVLSTYPVSVLFVNLAFYRSWQKLSSNSSDIYKQEKIIDKYSDNMNNQRR